MASLERNKPDTSPRLPAAADALATMLVERFSCRAFLPEPLPRSLIETMLSLAQNAASWCNSQPWHVHVTEGSATERLRTALFREAQSDIEADMLATCSDIPFPPGYTGVYKERQREVGWQLYEAVGVAYGDRVGSGKQTLENFRLFGAPHALVVTTERDLGAYGILDCGSYLGTLLLAAQSLGIGIIPQAALAHYCPTIREFFNIPETRDIVFGASFGWPDLAHPANAFRSRRAAIADTVDWSDT